MVRQNVGKMSPAFITPLPEFAEKVSRRNMATTGHILAPYSDLRVYQGDFKGKDKRATWDSSR